MINKLPIGFQSELEPSVAYYVNYAKIKLPREFINQIDSIRDMQPEKFQSALAVLKEAINRLYNQEKQRLNTKRGISL